MTSGASDFSHNSGSAFAPQKGPDFLPFRGRLCTVLINDLNAAESGRVQDACPELLRVLHAPLSLFPLSPLFNLAVLPPSSLSSHLQDLLA